MFTFGVPRHAADLHVQDTGNAVDDGATSFGLRLAAKFGFTADLL